MKQTSSNISTLLSGKIDKDEHPTGKEILHSNQIKKNTKSSTYIFSFKKCNWKKVKGQK